MKFTRVAFVKLFVCFVALPLVGDTSIVVIRDSTKIIAGFDSKRKSGTDAPDMIACKVTKTGNLFWTMAGHQADWETLIEEIQKENPSYSIRQTVEQFSADLQEPLARSIDTLRFNNPSDYQRFMVRNNGTLEFIFFGMENQIPVVAHVGIKATEDAQQNVSLSIDTNIVDTPTCGQIRPCGFAAGYQNAMVKYIDQHGIPQLTQSKINKFIDLEIKEAHEEVGPPIRILTIDSHGARWMQGGEGCNIGIPGETKVVKKTVPKKK